MSYTTPDFTDDVINALQAAGYEVQGACFDEASGHFYSTDLQASNSFWFTWARPGHDTEVGEMHENELLAWLEAFGHLCAQHVVTPHLPTQQEHSPASTAGS